MAKTKNKNRFSSEKTLDKQKKKVHSNTVKNPFDVHVNNEKLKVLGKKSKNNVGLPGISRAKAIDKRKKTLLQEYKVQNKSNVFIDRRIGEKEHMWSSEEKQIARFAAVRAKAHKRGSIFNLGEDEVLTHKGISLSEIEKFDDPRSDDDFDDERETGKLDENFVEEAHFGGGMLKKTGVEGAKSHKDLIDQLISESKKRRAEKQKIKEATMELTEKLDSEWKDLIPFVNSSAKKTEDVLEKPKVDDYDKVMRQLKFEARGTVSDRLKSEEEIAKEEKMKLEKLENERLERMKGVIEDKPKKITHRSADDLEDDLVYESEPENEVTLSYDNDGQSNLLADHNLEIAQNEQISEENEESSDSEEAETESEDDLSDLKADSSESEEETEIVPKETKKNKEIEEEKSEIKIDLLKRKEIMENARNELPYTFSLPKSYEQLQSTLANHSYIHQGIILERMIKCNHSSLAKGNKDNLGLLFAFILQNINDVASEVNNEESIKNCFHTLEATMPHLFDLAQMNPDNCHNSIKEVIKEKYHDYLNKPKEYPGLENLIFLKIVHLLFTTSDFRHQVVTPCLVFMEYMLIKCQVKTKRHIAYGLFLTTLVLEYTALSKRFLPGCLNFLGGILHMAIPKTVRIIKVIPPFSSTSSQLALLENQKNWKKSLKMEVTDLIDSEITDSFKIRVLYTTFKLINEFFDNLKHLPNNIELFSHIYDYSKMINTDMYPAIIRTEINNFIKQFDLTKNERVLKPLVLEDKKPKALRLYEPKIQEVYDGKKYKVQSKEKAERDKLLHKLKREKKGALREIRRDNAFLGRVQITEQIQSDRERKEKVKRIFAEASIQQSELNELDRKKKKK